jgi:D-alanyl-lipoteichoic acid acyltransferase DltB (MBOAT superfamily)
MSFISLSFLVFFPLVTVLYFKTPQRMRWALLLFASCVFYMAFIPAYIFVLFGLIVVDYTAGRLLENATGASRKYILLASIVSTCTVLLIFKYFNFANENIAALASFLDWHYPIQALSIALPLGLSFHTFQSLSYVIEVYRGKYKAEHHFGIYALYVMFYPQLVAGPIERPQQLLPQFYENHVFEYERAKNGLIRMVWGFFKKMAVADNLALMVNPVFANPQHFGSLALLMASVCFTLQIYFDFSAYCDIALGAAQVMGFTLMENFNRPFAAKSIGEFWRRWHISLSSWFRDYFYYPLVLSQKKITPAKIYAATLFTFLVTGFWHGANWTFGMFGLLHGLYIVLETAAKNARQKLAEVLGLLRMPWLHEAIQVAITFILVTIAFVFFRAESIADAAYVLGHIATDSVNLFAHANIVQLITVLNPFRLLLALALSAFIFWCEYLGRNDSIFSVLAKQKTLVRWGFYFAIMYMIITFDLNIGSQFIYFQF